MPISPDWNGMKFLALIIVAAAALAVPTAAMSDAKRSTGVTLQVRASRFGKILFDGRGFVLYAFTRDSKNKSNCYGACAKAWPVYYSKAALRAGSGVKQSLLGTTRRSDGRRQVTYAGRPLYYYVGDTRPGLITCQNVFEYGGLWLVVRGNGSLVK
jgi:predicted lipoprotein with Yx(FWY)xxD motif